MTLRVNDLLGRCVDRIADRSFTPGYHCLSWTPANLVSGTYFVRLQQGTDVQTRRITLVK